MNRLNQFVEKNTGVWPLLLAALCGALITLSFAPFNIWPLGLIALTGFALLMHTPSTKLIVRRSLAFGIGLFGAGIHWIYVSIHNFGDASPLLAGFLVFIFAIFLAGIFTLPFYAYARWFCQHKLGPTVALPILWLAGEWMRTWLLTGFPWLFIGYGHLHTGLAGWAPLIGVLGTGFWVVFSSCVIAHWLIVRHPKRHLIALTTIALSAWLLGAFMQSIQWTEPEARTIRVGMVQPNVDQSIKLNWSNDSVVSSIEQLRTMSDSLWQNDWIIWPEAAIPTSLTYHSALPFLEEINTKAAQTQTALFTGVIYDEIKKGDYNYYNSIVGLGEGLGFYHKRRLVPFGEYVPLGEYVRGIIEFFDMPTSFINLGPQDQHGLIAQGVRITPAICYEIVYPDLIATSAKETQVLVNVNNLGWFLDSIQSKQFMQMAQMRALETGRYLIYSTNNGPSAIIDSKGSILAQSHSFAAQTFEGVIHPVNGITPFMYFGSWPLILIALGCLFCVSPLLQKTKGKPL